MAEVEYAALIGDARQLDRVLRVQIAEWLRRAGWEGLAERAAIYAD